MEQTGGESQSDRKIELNHWDFKVERTKDNILELPVRHSIIGGMRIGKLEIESFVKTSKGKKKSSGVFSPLQKIKDECWKGEESWGGGIQVVLMDFGLVEVEEG